MVVPNTMDYDNSSSLRPSWYSRYLVRVSDSLSLLLSQPVNMKRKTLNVREMHKMISSKYSDMINGIADAVAVIKEEACGHVLTIENEKFLSHSN